MQVPIKHKNDVSLRDARCLSCNCNIDLCKRINLSVMSTIHFLSVLYGAMSRKQERWNREGSVLIIKI